MLWYIGFGLEKYSDYITGFKLILCVGLRFEKYSTTLLDLDWLYVFMIYWTWTWKTLNTRTTYLTGLGLILLNIGLGLINQPSRDVFTKVWRLSWINCFLPFNIALIHAAFTAPSFRNLRMMIPPSTLLFKPQCFLCSSGYCMSLSHMSITHLECFPIL